MTVRGRRRLRAVAAVGAAAALGVANAPALAQQDAPPLPSPVRGDPALDEWFEHQLQELLPDGYTDPDTYEALLTYESGRYVRAREQAEAILERDPRSVGGHVVLALVLNQGEGNLGLARYHFRRALDLFEEQYGLPPQPDSPWRWHFTAYNGLADADSSMGRDEEVLEVLRERDRFYGYRPGDYAWSLMRLARYDEARAVAAAALEFEDEPHQHTAARIGLCGVAGELLQRSLAYERCLEAIEEPGDSPRNDPVLQSNAAEAALAVLRFDAAERHYLAATQLPTYGTPANPWMELTRLYVAEGRIQEARDAMREMFAWRASQPAIIDAQTRSAIDLTSATFLLVAGHPVDAARVAARGVDRPDRQGAISFTLRARRAGDALMDRVANRTAAELHWERASWLSGLDAWRARLEAVRRSLRAWWSSRRARGLLADERMLLHTALPYASGTAVLPEWLQPALVEVVGAGPVAAVLREARAVEPVAGDEGYLLALEAEAAHVDGRSEEAARLAQAALAALPGAEVLLRARVAARGGQDALGAGQRALATDLLDRALQGDPGVVRRLGIALPCSFEVEGGAVAHAAAELLADSPRFDDAGFGFRVRTRERGSAVESCLIGPTGSLHACAQAAPEPGETEDAQARRLAAEFHAAALAPRVDLTQADLDSLDGATTTVGIRGTDRARELLAEWGLGTPDSDDSEANARQ